MVCFVFVSDKEKENSMYRFKKILENVYVLKAPFSIVWTGITLIKGEKNFLIDSGADAPEVYLKDALEELGMKISDIDYLLNTHCHGDHITGHFDLVTKYGLKTATCETGLAALRDPAANAIRIRTKYPEHSPAPQSWLKGADPDIVLADGETLEGRLTVISTPGHDKDCVCWYDIPTKTLITGDSLQGNGTPSQGIGFYQSLADYEYTLEKLSKLDVENIILGHEYDGIGDFIIGRENVKAALEYCAEIPRKYEARISSYLSEGLTDPAKIAVRLIEELGCGMPEKLFLAFYTVHNHLDRLANK